MDDVKVFVKKLNKLGSEVLPQVIAETLTRVGSEAHRASIINLRSRMVQRNQYTERSLRFYKATEKKDISRINSISGSISPYLDDQDMGGVRVPKVGATVVVPTIFARGDNPNKVILARHFAGTLNPNEFLGVPKGAIHRPYGVYARINKNTKLKLVRNLSLTKVDIKENKWHRDAVSHRATQSNIEKEFMTTALVALKLL